MNINGMYKEKHTIIINKLLDIGISQDDLTSINEEVHLLAKTFVIQDLILVLYPDKYESAKKAIDIIMLKMTSHFKDSTNKILKNDFYPWVYNQIKYTNSNR